MAAFDLASRDVSHIALNRQIGREHLFHEALKRGQTGRYDRHDIVHSAAGCDAMGHFI